MNPEKQAIQNDPYLQKYFRKRNQSTKSRTLITDRFYYYHQATSLTPTTAIKEADQEEEEGIRLRRRKIIEHLDTFEEYLQDRYSENTIRSSISTIRSFYKHNLIQLPDPNRKPRPNNKTVTVDDLPDIQDIRLALTECKPRDTAIIILMASSGMGKSEIISLTWQHLINAVSKYEKVTVDDLFNVAQTRPTWVENIGPLIWHVRRVKTGHDYFTFSSPESFDKLLRYINTRHQVLLKPRDPIFITNRKEAFNEDNFGDIFTRLNNRCQFGTGVDGLSYFRSHNLRKWFANTLNKRMDSDNVQRLMGHTDTNKTREAYIKPDLNELYKEYYSNLDLVTVTREVEIHDTTEEIVEEMQKEREEDRETIKWLKEEVMVLKKEKEIKSKMDKVKR